MNPLAIDFPFPDLHWWLRKKHKTCFATRKNAPGKPAGWYDAMRKLKAEHAEGKLTEQTANTLTHIAEAEVDDITFAS